MADNEVIFAHEIGVERLDDDTIAITCRGDIAARMTNDAMMGLILILDTVATSEMAAQLLAQMGQRVQEMLKFMGNNEA